MRLLADENVRSDVVASLRVAGHDVTVVPSGVTNGAVLSLATAERRMLLTHDKDFAALWTSGSAQRCSIVLVRIHPPDAKLLTKALTDAFSKLTSDTLEGRLVTIDAAGFRIQ